MRVCIFGAGWVGVLTAVAFAEVGHTVNVYEIQEERLRILRSGEVPFFEPGLSEALRMQVATGRLVFLSAHESVVGDVFLCCVGTPSQPDGSADIREVFSCAARVAAHDPSAVFVVKSTVPPGVCEEIRDRFPSLHVVSNPEFLAEGTALSDAREPTRILWGTHDDTGALVGTQLYASWISRHIPYIATDLATASCAKYVANAFLATRISFMNEMSEFAETVGADTDALVESLRYDDRIGAKFLSPGLGFGGSCFPKDLRALAYTAQKKGMQTPLIREVLLRNDRQVVRYVEKIIRCMGDATGHVAILGVAFKPGTNDIRFSPSLAVLDALRARNISVQWFDPVVSSIPQGIVRADSCQVAVQGSACVFLATHWSELGDFVKTLPQARVVWGRPRGTL